MFRHKATILVSVLGIIGGVCTLSLNSVLASAPATVFTLANHRGISQITADGVPLLTGCGLNFIGSFDGVDDMDNVSTCWGNGTPYMRPADGGTEKVSAQLYFVNEGIAGERKFGGQIGPVEQALTSASMPFDARKDICTHYRYSGSSTLRDYNSTPDDSYYAAGVGTVNVHYAGPDKRWGEVICGDYVARVSLDPANPDMKLFFVDHPATNNVEFSFDSIAKGQQKNVVGRVTIRDNDIRVANATYEAESSNFYHQIGRQQSGGWSVNVNDTFNRYMLYGPYTKMTASGARTAKFRVMFDNVTADNLQILTLDVYDANTGTILASKPVRRQDLNAANTYQDITVPFTSNSTSRLEFRAYYHGYSYVRIDRVVVN